jgi:EmrB/QacA subfamily drug resistance transporter
MSDRSANVTGKMSTLLITSIGMFLAPIMVSTVNVALPSISKQFEIEAVLAGWVSTGYTLAATVFLIPIGRVADIYGRKKVFTCGIWLVVVSSILCGISGSVTMLIVFRAFQGIGSAMIFATSTAIVTSVFPVEERGKALGINTATVYLGLSLGPFLGGVLTQNLTWRSIFFASALLSLIAGILVFGRLKGEWAEAKGEKFDYISSIIFSFAIIMLMYGFSVLPSVLGFILVALGILGMVIFVRKSLSSASPIINISVIGENRLFLFSCLAALVNYAATFAVTFLLSLYLQYNKGYSPQTAGLILIVQPVFQTIFSPIAGRLSDRFFPQKVATFGIALTCLGLIPLIFFADATGLGFIIASLAFLGFGYAFFSSPNTSAVMGSLDRKYLGVAAGTLAAMRNGGMVFSMGIVMILFALFIGDAQITAQNYASFLLSQKVSFVIFTILCFISMFIQYAARKAKTRARTLAA